MMAFSLWKNLKKHLRRKRRPMWTLGAMLPLLPVVGGLLLLYPLQSHAAEAVHQRISDAGIETFSSRNQKLMRTQAAAAYGQQDNGQLQEQRRKLLENLENSRGPLTVKLHRIYVCGEELKPLGRIAGRQLAGLLRSHPEWRVIEDEQPSSIIIEQQIDDLSEQCKATAYMGVDKAGRLSLYDGEPKKEKVMRTFFQLDVEFMESSLPQDKLDQLANGIRISDIDEFNSVISTYSDFALEPNEKVMNQLSE